MNNQDWELESSSKFEGLPLIIMVVGRRTKDLAESAILWSGVEDINGSSHLYTKKQGTTLKIATQLDDLSTIVLSHARRALFTARALVPSCTAQPLEVHTCRLVTKSTSTRERKLDDAFTVGLKHYTMSPSQPVHLINHNTGMNEHRT
jgi:hypothetical protein